MIISSTPWQTCPDCLPQLQPGQIHLWRFSLDIIPPLYQSQRAFLSDDELARADRFLDPQKQQQFTLARSYLRQILAQYLDLPPELIKFIYNDAGKPSLGEKNRNNLTFNLSHSGAMAVLAVAIDVDLGVDIEEIDFDLNFQSLAIRYFTPAEIIKLKEVSIARQRRQFYRIWTSKEAVLKMIGSGFSAAEPPGNFMQHGCLRNIFFAGNYVSAIAINRRITSILKFNILESESGENSPLTPKNC